jgi:hypothetical protein
MVKLYKRHIKYLLISAITIIIIAFIIIIALNNSCFVPTNNYLQSTIPNQNEKLSISQLQAIKVSFDKLEIDDKDRQLWNKTVRVYLHDNLWSNKNAYDAGHYLMIPLHAAFQKNESAWQQQFADHFQNFIKNGYDKDFTVNRLTRLQYLYLCSRFVVLAEQAERGSLIPPFLIDAIYDEINNFWSVEPAWQWNREPFTGGIRERVIWKLNTHDVKKSYYRAIIDEELFLFAIAADLHNYERYANTRHKYSATVAEILKIAHVVFQKEIAFLDGEGWLFQPGVWTDHPDYAYAGREEKVHNMKPSKVTGIAWDTSHSHRFPLWLTSLSNAYQANEPERNFYNNLKKELEQVFFMQVLEPPSCQFPVYRTKNYMDGRNGVYRWNYSTQGVNNGYGPYELSGTLTLGWWAFLGTDHIRTVYQEISKQFPLSKEVIDVYVGPNTSRERHPLVLDPDSYTNGFRELIIRLAGKLV